MGLFSGSFGTGLITGLATSVDKSLRDAMDKRDEELSSARKFWQTRQAQKMDLAEQRDSRIKKSLNRLIDEMDGDVASGLAAFKAAGGDPDSVELFIKDLDETRASGLEYNLKDKLKLDGVDLSQFGDLTRERAFASVRTELSPVDIQMQDTGLLANIGLGMKDMGKGISEELNKLIPAREQEAIEGITGAVLDRSGMITSERYKREVEAAIPDMKKQLSSNLYQINNKTDVMGKSLSEDQIQSLKKENARLIASIGDLNKAEAAASDTGPSLSQLASSYSSELSRLQKDLGYQVSSSTGIVSLNHPELGIIEGPEAQKYMAQQTANMEQEWVANNIFDTEGQYTGKDSDFAVRSLGLSKVADKVRMGIVGGDEAEAQQSSSDAPQPPKAASDKDDTGPDFSKPQAVVEAPAAFADYIFSQKPDIDPAQLFNSMVQSGVPEATAAAEAERILQQQKAVEEAAKNKPKYVPGKGLVDPNDQANKVIKRPGGLAGMNWDRMYSKTHNPDGTPK